MKRKKTKRGNAKTYHKTEQKPSGQFATGHYVRRFEAHERICEFVFVVCALLLGGMSAFSAHRLPIVWTTGIGLCAATLAFCFWFTDRELGNRTETRAARQAGTFSARYTWSENRGDTVATWYATDWDVTPIYCSLLVSFTNLEPHTILVESYIAEHQRKDGSWEVVSLPFGTSHGKVFWGVDRKDVREAKYTTLDDAFEGKNIAPSETVRGWLFLTKRFTGVLRLKIATSIGESYTEPLTGMATGGWASQPMLFEKVGPPHLDISNLPITE